MRTHAIIVALLFTANASAGNPPFHFEGSGKLASGATYEVTVNEKQFARKPGDAPDDGSMWGIDGGFCSNVVGDFSVIFDGQPAYIGRKFYSDICDLTSVTPLERDGKFVLKVTGGDGAGAFVALYTFDDGELVERMVEMAEMPEDYWEKTIIHHDL